MRSRPGVVRLICRSLLTEKRGNVHILSGSELKNGLKQFKDEA